MTDEEDAGVRIEAYHWSLVTNHVLPLVDIDTMSRDEKRIFINALGMDKHTGRLINLFDFCQPITVVYCGKLTKERAQSL